MAGSSGEGNGPPCSGVGNGAVGKSSPLGSVIATEGRALSRAFHKQMSNARLTYLLHAGAEGPRKGPLPGVPAWMTLLDKGKALQLFTSTYTGMASLQESRNLLTQKCQEARAVSQQVCQ